MVRTRRTSKRNKELWRRMEVNMHRLDRGLPYLDIYTGEVKVRKPKVLDDGYREYSLEERNYLDKMLQDLLEEHWAREDSKLRERKPQGGCSVIHLADGNKIIFNQTEK